MDVGKYPTEKFTTTASVLRFITTAGPMVFVTYANVPAGLIATESGSAPGPVVTKLTTKFDVLIIASDTSFESVTYAQFPDGLNAMSFGPFPTVTVEVTTFVARLMTDTVSVCLLVT